MGLASEDFIVKTNGTCEELKENHAHALILALRMADKFDDAIVNIDSKLTGLKRESEETRNDIRSLTIHIGGITDWQTEHDKRIKLEKEFEERIKQAKFEAEQNKEEEKKRFWASGWGTAAKAAISVSVVAIVGFFSSIFGGGFAEWAKTWLAK